MATVVSAKRRGPVRGPTKPPNQTVEAFAEEMINGILCHYEPPDPGRHTSKNRSILRPPSFGGGNNGRSRSDLTTAMSNVSTRSSNSSSTSPPTKRKNVRWIDVEDNKPSAAARVIIGPVSRCGNAGNRIYDAGVDVGCLSPSSQGQNNDVLSQTDTYGGIWSSMSEESEIPCRRSQALKDAVYDEDGNPVSSRPGGNLPAPPSAPPPPRRKELFIPELCGVRINCFEDEEQMEELSRYPYGRTPSPVSSHDKKGGRSRRGHSVDYEDEENSLTQDEELVKSDRKKRNSRSRRSSSIAANVNEPRDSDSEPRDEEVDIKSDNRKSKISTKTTNGQDDWEESSSPPASSGNTRPALGRPPSGPSSLRRDENGDILNQTNPGNVMDPVIMSRASSEVNVPQDRPQPQTLQQQPEANDDDWDQSIPIVQSLSDSQIQDDETQTSPTPPTEIATTKKSSSKDKPKKSTDKAKKETGTIERAKAMVAEKLKKAEDRKAEKQKKIAEKKAEERRRSEGSKETLLSEKAAEDLRKIEEAKRTTEDLKRLEQLRINEVSKLSEQVRQTEENILREERRMEEELKKAAELRRIEEVKIAEELKRAEAIRADAMKRAEALMKMERSKEAHLLRRLEAARNADLLKLSAIDPTDSLLSYYGDIASQGSVILSTELSEQQNSSRLRRGRKQDPRNSATLDDDKDSRRRSFDPLLLMRRRSRSRSPGRSKSPGRSRSKSPNRHVLFRRRQTIDAVVHDDDYVSTSASRSYSPGNSDAGLNDYGLKTRTFGTASTSLEADRESFINAHRDSVESNMQVSRERAARAKRNEYLGHPPMPHLHPAHPLNQYRTKGQNGRGGDDMMERQSYITAHRQGFDAESSKIDDDSMDRQSFITAHREGFEVLSSKPPLDDDRMERESFITDHRRGFESQGPPRLGKATSPVAQPDFVVETATSGDDSMGLTSPVSAASTGSVSVGSDNEDPSILEPPKVRPTLTPPEPEKKEEEMSWEEKTRLAWERIRNGFGLTSTEETTDDVPALKASEDSGDTRNDPEQTGKEQKEETESENNEGISTPQTPPISPRASSGHSPNVSPSRRRSVGSPRTAMGKLFQSSSGPREQLPQQHLMQQSQQQRPKGILKTPTPEKRVTFGHDSEKIFTDDHDENMPSPRSNLASPLNAHVHPHMQHGQMYMPHNHHGLYPHQRHQPFQPQPHLQQPLGTPPIDNKSKKVKRVFRGTKLITNIFKAKSSPQGSKSPRGRSPLRVAQAAVQQPNAPPSHLRLMTGGLDATVSSSLDSTRSASASGSSYLMNAYSSDAPGAKPGAIQYYYGPGPIAMPPNGSSSYSMC